MPAARSSPTRAQVKSLPYDPINDFAGVTIFQEGYFILVSRPEDKGMSLAQFFEKIRKDPARSPIGGTSATAQISNILMSNAAKLMHTYVPYKDFAPMLNDLLGGRLVALFTPINSILPNIAQGQVSPVGVMSPARLPVLANTPAIAEVATGAALDTWLGFMVPAKTPQPVIDYLYEKMAVVMKDPANLKWNENAGRAVFMKPAEVDAFVRKDEPRWMELFKAAGIEPQ